MRIILDIPDELVAKIRRVKSLTLINDFILVAIENQIAIEKSEFDELIKPIQETTPNKSIIEEEVSVKTQVVPRQKRDSLPNLFKILKKDALPFDEVKTIQLQYPIKNDNIWGQYNKFFPVKCILRYLIFSQAQNNNNMIPLEKFNVECVEYAVKIRKLLVESDINNNRLRGEAFAAGFPKSTENSKTRFINHFIGCRTGGGDPVGEPFAFGFIDIINGMIGITSYGLEFAKLTNPLIDADSDTNGILSDAEREFLIHHIKTNLSTEWSAIVNIIRWIEDGANTPDLLNNKIRTLNSKWTTKVVNTMRTGYLGRIFDLGLITRHKSGVNVRYILTEAGKRFGGIS